MDIVVLQISGPWGPKDNPSITLNQSSNRYKSRVTAVSFLLRNTCYCASYSIIHTTNCQNFSYAITSGFLSPREIPISDGTIPNSEFRTFSYRFVSMYRTQALKPLFYAFYLDPNWETDLQALQMLFLMGLLLSDFQSTIAFSLPRNAL